MPIDVNERTKTNSTGELIKMLMLALAESKPTQEEMIRLEDNSQKIKEEFVSIFNKYKHDS